MDNPATKPWENLYWTREAANLNQTQMGFLIGTSSSQYGKIEAGQVNLDHHRIRICHLLGLKWQQLSVPLAEYNREYRDRAVAILQQRLDSIHELIGQDVDQLGEPSRSLPLEPVTEAPGQVYSPLMTMLPDPLAPLSLRIDQNGRPVLIRAAMELIIHDNEAPLVGLALQALGGAE